MKNILLLLLVIINFIGMSQTFDSLQVMSRNSKSQRGVYLEMEPDTISRYTIIKIDSINSHYYIFAKNDKYRYKIISPVDSIDALCYCDNPIIVNGEYQFDLRAVGDNNYIVHIDDSFRGFPLGINCHRLSANDDVCREDLGYYDISIDEQESWDRKIILGGDDIHKNREKYNLVNPKAYGNFNTALNLKGLCLVKKY